MILSTQLSWPLQILVGLVEGVLPGQHRGVGGFFHVGALGIAMDDPRVLFGGFAPKGWAISRQSGRLPQALGVVEGGLGRGWLVAERAQELAVGGHGERERG